MDAPEPILNWVREDDHDIIITGGAVRTGKPVNMQARWQPWGSYMGPERFTVHRSRKAFGALGRSFAAATVTHFVADVDGPPTTHSLQAWQAGNVDPLSNQSRYYFTDAYNNKSGTLTVSNVAHYTSAPSFQVEGDLRSPLAGSPGITARGGQARAIFHVGATTDPTVRVTLMGGSSRELLTYLEQQQARFPGPRTIFTADSPRVDDQPWRPILSTGGSEIVVDVDEDHPVEITVIPERPYTEPPFAFISAFALRVENVNDPSQFVVSDVITVEGGERRRTQAVRSPDNSVVIRS
jgi:hypothetical protein